MVVLATILGSDGAGGLSNCFVQAATKNNEIVAIKMDKYLKNCVII
jgi:hypothetical protein